MRNNELKIRLDDQEYNQFLQACAVEKISPASKGRELLVQYSNTILRQSENLSLFQPKPKEPHGYKY